MPQVLNIRRIDKDLHTDAVYIGRGRGSILGNPFTYLHVDGTLAEFQCRTREESIERFELYARERIQHDPVYRQAVVNLWGKDLLCFCAPQACHGDILMKLTEELHQESQIDT